MATVASAPLGRASYQLAEKYSLRPRSIQKRIEVEQKKHVKRTPKPKQKPAPLSKYRRKTANARERSRMKEINAAFETLRKAIPQTLQLYSGSPSPCNSSGSSSSSSSSSSNHEKWTKITTLRLAMDYIETLTQVLDCPANLTAQEFQDNANTLLASAHFALDHRASSLSSSLGSSSSDLGDYCTGDLLSEASSSLGDPLDSFDDIPNIGMGDPFDIFLESDGDSLHFHSDLSDQPTP